MSENKGQQELASCHGQKSVYSPDKPIDFSRLPLELPRTNLNEGEGQLSPQAHPKAPDVQARPHAGGAAGAGQPQASAQPIGQFP